MCHVVRYARSEEPRHQALERVGQRDQEGDLEVRIRATGEDEPRGSAEEADASGPQNAHDLGTRGGGPRQVLENLGKDDQVDTFRGQRKRLRHGLDLVNAHSTEANDPAEVRVLGEPRLGEGRLGLAD